MNEYPLAPLDRLNYLTTFGLLPLAFIGMLVAGALIPGPAKYVMPGLAIFIVVLLIICATYSPKAVTITADGLGIVRRKMPVLMFPWSEFTGFTVVRERWAWKSWNIFGFIKLWATAGFLGYYGWFYLKGRGVVRCYATRLDSGIILTGKRTVIITPAELDAVVSQIRGYVKAEIPV